MIHEIWENFTRSVFEYAINAYDVLDPWFYPLIFLGIIGYFYAGMQSITVAVVGILITFGVYATTTNIFADVEPFVQLAYIITVLGIMLLLVGVFIKRSRS